jgi:hypothetical protein
MSGQRHVMDSIGEKYETFADHMISRFASNIRVPRQDDYGIDLYALPRVSTGVRTETAVELCAIQIKGGESELVYGGLNQKGEWKKYDLDWLRSLTIPLYLARVDASCTTVDLFSLWPVWYLFHYAGNPFEIAFKTQPATEQRQHWFNLESVAEPTGTNMGDGRRWIVNLGPPFLHLTGEHFRDADFPDHSSMILRTWTSFDRTTVIRFLQGVPIVDAITTWKTNSIGDISTSRWQMWNEAPDVNVPRLARVIAPALTNLSLHLKSRPNEVAGFIPVLDWLDQNQHLDEIGKGLLRDLRQMQPTEEQTTAKPGSSIAWCGDQRSKE